MGTFGGYLVEDTPILTLLIHHSSQLELTGSWVDPTQVRISPLGIWNCDSLSMWQESFAKVELAGVQTV